MDFTEHTAAREVTMTGRLSLPFGFELGPRRIQDSLACNKEELCAPTHRYAKNVRL